MELKEYMDNKDNLDFRIECLKLSPAKILNLLEDAIDIIEASPPNDSTVENCCYEFKQYQKTIIQEACSLMKELINNYDVAPNGAIIENKMTDFISRAEV